MKFPLEILIFPLKQKRQDHHWIMHIHITLSRRFQLEVKILIFRNNFPQKGYFHSKTEKVNITIDFCIFKLVSISNISFKEQFWLFAPNLPKNGISALKDKREHHYWILYIQIGLNPKFQFEIIIITLWT